VAVIYIYESKAEVGEEHVTEKPGEAGGEGSLLANKALEDLLTRYMTSHSMALGVRRGRW